MRTARSRLMPLIVALSIAACSHAAEDRPQVLDLPEDAEQHYFAVEMKGTLAGYAHVAAYPAQIDGRQLTVMRHKLFILLSLLGSEFNTEIDQVFHVDPADGMSLYTRIEAQQGPSHFEWEARRDGDVAHISSTVGGPDRTVELPPEVLFPNPLYFPHLKRDFVDGSVGEKTYDVLEVREGEVQKVTYTRLREETVELGGKRWNTVVLDENHAELGFKLRIWLDKQSAMIVQLDLPNDRRVYLSEPRVVRKIEVANLTEDIVSRAGVLIPDFQSISYMKVRAVFRPSGLQVTPEMLNVPGQRFEGTVEASRVDGIFEISHPRYDGGDAPPFPPDFAADDDLREYLEPSLGIESDDPVLVARARELTAGATDSWEAATRISRWVAENIEYAIPGGGTARRTYDQRAGECGSHSVLVAALARAVGIPARLVWGCQYVPNYGGAFGQHGWNEVYMGDDAGWVPIDATSFEVDYVDSGHIRIGDYQSASSSLNPVEAEILEYRLGDGEVVVVGESAEAAPVEPNEGSEAYQLYVGKYRGPRGGDITVKVANDDLVVDIEGRVALPLLDADSEGLWRCKITSRVYVTFDLDGDGNVTALWIHELAKMRKTADAEEIDPHVPAELRGHLGTYLLVATNTEFTVSWRDSTLAIRQGDSESYSHLEEDTGEPGTWVSRRTGNRITFETDDAGTVTGLGIHSVSRAIRQ